MIALGFILIFLIFASARYAAQRSDGAMQAGAKLTVPGGQSAREVAREFLDENGAEDVQILEHTALVSDYFDPKRRVLFLNKKTAEGNDAAAWSVALHEAAHALQTGESLKALQWRIGNIQLTRYAPGILAFLGILFVILKRLPFRSAVLICGGICAIIMLVNMLSTPIEFNASQRALAWLENKLKKHPNVINAMTPILHGIAWRDTAIFLRSPIYCLFGLLPVGGKIRPNKKK